MSLVVEICVFPPTEAYRKDATLVAPVAQFVKEAAGCLGYLDSSMPPRRTMLILL